MTSKIFALNTFRGSKVRYHAAPWSGLMGSNQARSPQLATLMSDWFFFNSAQRMFMCKCNSLQDTCSRKLFMWLYTEVKNFQQKMIFRFKYVIKWTMKLCFVYGEWFYSPILLRVLSLEQKSAFLSLRVKWKHLDQSVSWECQWNQVGFDVRHFSNFKRLICSITKWNEDVCAIKILFVSKNFVPAYSIINITNIIQNYKLKWFTISKSLLEG